MIDLDAIEGMLPENAPDVGAVLVLRHEIAIELVRELGAARRVVEAARARFEVWTRDTYVELDEALKAYDAIVKGEETSG